MGAKKTQWIRFASQLDQDDSGGRLYLEGRYLDAVASPSGAFVAYAFEPLPTEPKGPRGERRLTQVYALDAESRATLVYEVDDAGSFLRVADDGSILYRTDKGVVIAGRDGARRFFEGHHSPALDGPTAWAANVYEGGAWFLVRRDLASGEVLRQDPFDTGNMPVHRLQNGDLVGYSGWLSPDGTATPLGHSWDGAMVSGDALIFSHPLGQPGQTERLRRGAAVEVLSDCIAATSADGQYAIALSMPPVEEAHARGMSQYEARKVELVDLMSGARKTLTALPFPLGRVLSWATGSSMVVANNGTVLRYDPTKDALLTPRPLETRALIRAGEVTFSAHEDGLRARGPGLDAFTPMDPQFLAASPGKKRFLTGHLANHFVIDRVNGGLVTRDMGRAARMVFAGDDHLVVLGSDGASQLVALEGGASQALALAGLKGLASLPDGFVAFFDKKIEQRNIDGSVRSTWPVSKPPKGFKADAVTEVHAQRGALYVVSNRRLFRCEEGGITHLLPAAEKSLGGANTAYPGPIRTVAVSSERVAIAVFSGLGSWHSVLVCTWDDQILGWTGAYSDIPVSLAWSGDQPGGDLLVTERTGRTHRVSIPR